MAAQRTSLRRRPLSDCTNTIAARTNAARRESSLRSALTQVLESFSQDDNEAPISSLKSNTSTGSNNPPISTNVRSALVSAYHRSENEETKKRNDKGKALVEDTVFQLEFYGRENEETRKKTKCKAHVKVRGYHYALDGKENEATKRRKDKGKAIVEGSPVQLALDGRENVEGKRRKDKSKMIVKDSVVQLDHLSPLRMKLSSATLPDSSRCRTVYTRKGVPEPRLLRSLDIAEPFSCHPLRRPKDKSKQIDGRGPRGGDWKSGMHRCSVPKKQSRSKSKQKFISDAMLEEEVEKLRAYYADIDTFELPVEEANDSE